MSDAPADTATLVAEVLAGGHDPRQARSRLDLRLQELGDRVILDDDPHDAVDELLTYLELDPYYFWSGFDRTRMAHRLAQAHLDAPQKERSRRYVLACIAGEKHCGQALRPLAGSVADSPMRRAVRAQLHSPDQRVARRALVALSGIRHPGMDDSDSAAARRVVLAEADRTWWLPPSVERLARWLWTPEWEAELRALTQHHDPERAAAKKLLESMDRRRAKRPGP